MANRKRSRRAGNVGDQARSPRQAGLWKSTVALAVPLVTGTAVVTVAVSELAPTPASASTNPVGSVVGGVVSGVGGVVSGVTGTVPKLLPSSSPSTSQSSGSSGSLPIKLPSLPNLLPSSSSSPSPSPAPSQSQSGGGSSSSSGGSGSKQPSSGKHPSHRTPAPTVQGETPPSSSSSSSSSGGLLGNLIGGSSSSAAPSGPVSQPGQAVGYALPIPASLVSGHPSLIGEGAPAPKKAKPAGPVTMSIPQGTPVNAVTAGTFKVVGSTIVLVGNDGATYTYKNVSTSAKPGKTKAGTRLGTSGPGGLTFSISVPDSQGLVDADEAMQAWSSGLTVNVRSLPSTIAPATAPVKNQVLVVGDSGARTVTSNLSQSLKGPLVAVHGISFDPSSYGAKSALGKQIQNAKNRLVVVALSNGTPAEAAALAKLLPHGSQMLWVIPSAKQAGAYKSLTAANPAFRTETLPSALAPSKNNWAQVSQLAAGTLTATYATTAYRLYAISSEANAALSFAELQLGKPYKWGANGPDAFDCSGLVMDALAQSGLSSARTSQAQWTQTKTHLVSAPQLKPGNLVFFSGSDGTTKNPGHVGIYVGDGEILDAPHTGANVRFDSLKNMQGFVGATNPFTLASGVPGAAQLASAQLAGLAAPTALSQYQAFARQLTASTWGPAQFTYLYQLWERESGWNPDALNPLSGAFGIPQSLPAGKMASAGMDWGTDPYTQILWGIGYISSAYGTPQAAWAHEESYGWY